MHFSYGVIFLLAYSVHSELDLTQVIDAENIMPN